MSIPRRLGRLASGFLSTLQEDERVRERLRTGRERSETLRTAFEAALRSAQAEMRRAEERRSAEGGGAAGTTRSGSRGAQGSGNRASGWSSSGTFAPLKYPPNVLSAYGRLGLVPGVSMDEVDRKRRELVKKFHPDRFPDPEKRARAERLTAEINAAHDAIERHVQRKSR
ncbi:MAG: DnaJ-class molecular chaperone [uncultured Rubrobacteraceae bacterium]|uniref:DnaJ-class molecular chaperone n=1 Tax=uncultured Rubrobacteraceae bacterium TaxID=349277 RepID=A0A6J4SP01_9ACTN|nr:MAG: DnaJ-class molecular chaperone [uncultured Rubrobacteraceae bacterium]